jgi:hypothetical protein
VVIIFPNFSEKLNYTTIIQEKKFKSLESCLSASHNMQRVSMDEPNTKQPRPVFKTSWLEPSVTAGVCVSEY